MNILAIDSSKKQAQISLFMGDKKFIHFMEENKSHSEFLLKEIEDFLSDNNLTIQNIDNLSVNVGPGSFTGVRIGISFVKAFSYALKQKCVVVNNFEIIDYCIENKDKSYYIVLGSNNEDFYYAYINDKKFSYGSINCEKLNEITTKSGEKVYFQKAEVCQFENLKNTQSVEISDDAFINLSINKVKNEEFLDIAQISPLYIKKSQAEMGLQQKINESLKILDNAKLSDIILLEEKCFDEPYSENLLKTDLQDKNRHQYFAFFNNELIGYINFAENFDELELFKICVLEEFRGYLIASKLMQKMIDYFMANKNLKSIFLEVDEKNVSAIKLYEKFGFVNISTRKNYYKNGDNALIYKFSKIN